MDWAISSPAAGYGLAALSQLPLKSAEKRVGLALGNARPCPSVSVSWGEKHLIAETRLGGTGGLRSEVFNGEQVVIPTGSVFLQSMAARWSSSSSIVNYVSTYFIFVLSARIA